jgi:hypothetical protein
VAQWRVTAISSVAHLWRSGASMTALSTTFRVGKRYRCEMRFDRARGLLAEWTPDTPRRLTTDETTDYRRGRDAFLAEVAKLIGGNVLVLE